MFGFCWNKKVLILKITTRDKNKQKYLIQGIDCRKNRDKYIGTIYKLNTSTNLVLLPILLFLLT